jgi:hypothetical protein
VYGKEMEDGVEKVGEKEREVGGKEMGVVDESEQGVVETVMGVVNESEQGVVETVMGVVDESEQGVVETEMGKVVVDTQRRNIYNSTFKCLPSLPKKLIPKL